MCRAADIQGIGAPLTDLTGVGSSHFAFIGDVNQVHLLNLQQKTSRVVIEGRKTCRLLAIFWVTEEQTLLVVFDMEIMIFKPTSQELVDNPTLRLWAPTKVVAEKNPIVSCSLYTGVCSAQYIMLTFAELSLLVTQHNSAKLYSIPNLSCISRVDGAHLRYVTLLSFSSYKSASHKRNLDISLR
jgi:hypothetical protein